MRYTDMLSLYIERSGLSLGEIARRMEEKGEKVDRSYLSKLKNGNTENPASEEINRVLAEVVGGDPNQLNAAAKVDRAIRPLKGIMSDEEINLLFERSDSNEVFTEIIRENSSPYIVEKELNDPFIIFDLVDKFSDDEIIAKYPHFDGGRQLDEETIRKHLSYVRFLKSQN